MDKTEAVRKAYDFSILVKDYLNFKKAFLFGSYVNGKPREDSDIDIAFFIDSLGEEKDYFSLLVQLNKLTRKVDCRIEPHIFDEETKSGFGELIKLNGEEIRIC
ncbi:MAG: nucleotidyltransferase domain-containing protein [Stygiobacter sp.]|jgi:predicted nucleotidyltransferase